jgi:cytoskeletal protein RodZ
VGVPSSEPIGLILREQREKQGLTLEEVEKATRIRARFLGALEDDDYAAMTSSTQARGFLSLYAQFLGLNAEQVIAAYDAGRKKPRARLPVAVAPPVPRPAASERPASAPRPTPRPAPQRAAGRAPVVRSRLPRWVSVDVFVGVSFTLVLGAFLVWGALQFIDGQGITPTSTPTRAATQAAASTASATPPLAAATPTPPLPTPLASYDGVNLIVRAEQRTWVRVVVDGAEAFAGLMPPGTSKEFNGQNEVELDTGNGQGTHVLWNGQDQGTLGQIGEVVIRLWTREGAMTPTPSVTPIPSITPTPTATPKQ